VTAFRKCLGILLVGLACLSGGLVRTAPLKASEAIDSSVSFRFRDDWRTYKTTFLAPEGRVVDASQKGASHSEGQGTGMLLAAAADDREGFDRIWRWTRRHLQRSDGLFHWKYDPTAADPITDPNDASDGDLLIAWALLRASRLWHDAGYGKESSRIFDAIEKKLIRRVGGYTVLLPGAKYFDSDAGATINPSYFIFPALQDAAVERHSEKWIELYEDSLKFLRAARFGRFDLPPDWAYLSARGTVRPVEGRKPTFGYDAMRIPLYLAWAGHVSSYHLKPFVQFWETYGGARGAPSSINLKTGEFSKYAPEPGVVAIRDFVLAAYRARGRRSDPRDISASLPRVSAEDSYYSASLIMLSRLALLDNRPAAASR